MNDSRTSLRNELLGARSAIDEVTQTAAAQHMVGVIAHAMPSTPGTVAAYLSHGGELDVVPAVQRLRELGWRVGLPVCGPKASMEFCLWTPGDPLVANRYGIDEPTSAPLLLAEIDVVLVPGVGFDILGSRIGHGVGFYDRYFARCRDAGHDPLKLGVAHDLQIIELPPPESWDVPMDRILTPTKVIDRHPCA